MRPLYLSLAIFGLYHTPKHSQVEPAKDTGDQNTNPPRILPKAIRFYCIFICCLMSLSVIRYLPSFWVGVDFIPDLTAHRIVNVIWTIENAVNSLVLFVFFEQKNHFERHEKQYISVTTDSISKRLKTNPRTEHVKRHIIRATIAGWMVVLFNTGFIIFLFFSDFSPKLAYVMCNPLSCHSLAVKILMCLFMFFSTGVWIFPAVLHYSLTSGIATQFQELYDVIDNTALEDCPNRFETLKCVRYKHLKLCKMVETVDQSLSYYIANVYLLNIGNACFIIYEMIHEISNDPNVPEIVISSFWLAACFLVPFITSVNSANVHEKVQLSFLNYISRS